MPQITGFSHVDISVSDLAASTSWYRDLLGMVELFTNRNDERGYSVTYLMEPNSRAIMGFEQHDANPGTPFDECRTGLDHLSWGVENREELDAWLGRLDDAGIAHSGIHESDLWDVLVFRDPDNVQLEFIYIKPAAIGILTSAVRS